MKLIQGIFLLSVYALTALGNSGNLDQMGIFLNNTRVVLNKFVKLIKHYPNINRNFDRKLYTLL